MFFINARVLDSQDRLNLSKFFKGDEVAIIYNDDKTFEILALQHPKIASCKEHVTKMKIDAKGRVALPVWVRKLAKTESFLISIRKDREWESVVLQPAVIALPAEKSEDNEKE